MLFFFQKLLTPLSSWGKHLKKKKDSNAFYSILAGIPQTVKVKKIKESLKACHRLAEIGEKWQRNAISPRLDPETEREDTGEIQIKSGVQLIEIC